jgi:hypothetical protein
VRQDAQSGRRHLRAFILAVFVCAERSTIIVKILVANSPRMYRESLALSLLRERPGFEVLITDPENLDGKVGRISPHVLVRDDDGVETGAPDGVVCWVGIAIDDHLNARIAVNGKVSELHNVSLEEFLAVLDNLERQLAANGR